MVTCEFARYGIYIMYRHYKYIPIQMTKYFPYVIFLGTTFIGMIFVILSLSNFMKAINDEVVRRTMYPAQNDLIKRLSTLEERFGIHIQ